MHWASDTQLRRNIKDQLFNKHQYISLYGPIITFACKIYVFSKVLNTVCSPADERLWSDGNDNLVPDKDLEPIILPCTVNMLPGWAHDGKVWILGQVYFYLSTDQYHIMSLIRVYRHLMLVNPPLDRGVWGELLGYRQDLMSKVCNLQSKCFTCQCEHNQAHQATAGAPI